MTIQYSQHTGDRICFAKFWKCHSPIRNALKLAWKELTFKKYIWLPILSLRMGQKIQFTHFELQRNFVKRIISLLFPFKSNCPKEIIQLKNCRRRNVQFIRIAIFHRPFWYHHSFKWVFSSMSLKSLWSVNDRYRIANITLMSADISFLCLKASDKEYQREKCAIIFMMMKRIHINMLWLGQFEEGKFSCLRGLHTYHKRTSQQLYEITNKRFLSFVLWCQSQSGIRI